MPEPVREEIEVEVRYAETDQMGVVHHASYLVWFELARTRLCAGAGHHYADIERQGFFLTVVGAEVSYRRPARYGETVRVVCWIDALWSRGVRFAYEVRRGPDLLARGATDHVWVNRSNGRPCRLPEILGVSFRTLAGLDGALPPGPVPATARSR